MPRKPFHTKGEISRFALDMVEANGAPLDMSVRLPLYKPRSLDTQLSNACTVWGINYDWDILNGHFMAWCTGLKETSKLIKQSPQWARRKA